MTTDHEPLFEIASEVAAGHEVDWSAVAESHPELADRLQSLQHILGVHGADVHDGRVGLWCELLDGRTLETVLEGDGRLASERVLEIGRDVARALTAVHDAGIVHGDVKASNVAVEPDGRAILLDFGAGIDLAETDRRSASYGSPLSTAPERLEGANPTPASDIWSLGVLLYRLTTTGDYPFRAPDLDALKEVHRQRHGSHVMTGLGSVPRGLRQLMESMFDPNPDLRPSAAAVADRLRWIAHAPLRRRRRTTVAVVIASLVIGAVAATIGYVRARNEATRAELARRDAEDVNDFLGQVLGAPRSTQGGRNVRMAEVLDDAAHRVQSDLPVGSTARAQILHMIGGTYLALDQFERAEALLDQAVAELTQVYGPHHPRTLRATIKLADTLRETGRKAECDRMLAQVAEVAPTLPADASVQLWLRVNQAVSARTDGDDTRAEQLLREAWALRAGSQWRGDIARQTVAVHLSNLWLDQGRFSEIVDFLTPIADELEETRGMRHGNTLVAWNNLAVSLANLNHREEALVRLERVADVAENWLGPDHRYAFGARVNVATTAKELGRVAEAADIERQLVDRAVRVFGPDHPSTLQTEANLALSLKQLGQVDEAEERMESLAKRTVSALGPDHPLNLILAVNRAELCLDRDRPRQAVDIVEPIRQRFAPRLGDGHLFILALDSVVGAARCAVGDTETGVATLQATVEAQRSLGGPNDQQALLTLIRLGEGLAASGDHDAASSTLREAVDIAEASLPSQHPLAVTAREALARLKVSDADVYVH
jgi:tetratricopeptide (TPR) repeat protein